MSDTELRELLRGVMDDIDAGRIRLPKPRWRRLRKIVAPSLLAAAMGLAACESEGVGTDRDGAVEEDAAVDVYQPPLPDGMPEHDATLDAAADAQVDGYAGPVYAAPPPIEPD